MYVHECTRTYIHAYIRAYTRIFLDACMHTYTLHAHACTRTHVCTRTLMYAHLRALIRSHAPTHSTAQHSTQHTTAYMSAKNAFRTCCPSQVRISVFHYVFCAAVSAGTLLALAGGTWLSCLFPSATAAFDLDRSGCQCKSECFTPAEGRLIDSGYEERSRIPWRCHRQPGGGGYFAPGSRVLRLGGARVHFRRRENAAFVANLPGFNPVRPQNPP